MGISKKIILLIMGFFYFVACQSAIKDETEFNELPTPDIQKYRTLVVLPLENDRYTKRDRRFVLKSTQIYDSLFSHLQFFDSMPFNWNFVKVKNLIALQKYYQENVIQKPSPKNKKKHPKQKLAPKKEKSFFKWVEHILKEKTEYTKMKEQTDKVQKLLKILELPKILKVHVQEGSLNEKAYQKKNYLIVKAKVNRERELEILMYDSMTNQVIIHWVEKMSYAFVNSVLSEEVISQFIQAMIYKILPQQNVFDLVSVQLINYIMNSSVYIDNKLTSGNFIFLSKGKHSIYVTQGTSIVKKGVFFVHKSGQINIQLDKKLNDNTFSVSIQTNPQQAGIFIDEKYQGIAPIKLNLPKGLYNLRATTLGYKQINYNLVVSDNKKKPQNINLNFQEINEDYFKKLKQYQDIKRASFFSGIFLSAGLVYTAERSAFYKEKWRAGFDKNYNYKRYKQFSIISYGLLAGGVSLFTTALIAQIFELKASDLGVGITQDKKLGVTWKF